jgi:hypothetical protein
MALLREIRANYDRFGRRIVSDWRDETTAAGAALPDRRNGMTKALIALALMGPASLPAAAQELPRFAFNLGGGFTTPQQEAGDRLDRGWNVDLGAGFRAHPNFALLVDFTYNEFGINRATLDALGFPNGNVRLWSVTLDPVVHLNPRGPMDLYLIGGGGLYQWTQEFTRPATAFFTGFDPFFGFYTTAIPVEEVLSSYTVNKPGWNGGAGLSFGTRSKFYAEARYHRVIFGNDRYVDTVPVTFGIRW